MLPTPPNPFTPRGRITDPRQFVGRWRELSIVFDYLEAGRPVLVGGVAGVGKSSFVNHLAQSAAVNLEEPDLDALYVDLSRLETPGELYNLVIRALRVGGGGRSAGALEAIIQERSDPVILCLDRAESAFLAGWGVPLLEELARIARRSRPGLGSGAQPVLDPHDNHTLHRAAENIIPPTFLLAAAYAGSPPQLSEPFASVSLGALSTAETRLFTSAYLEPSGVVFAPTELHSIYGLSLGHPAYMQRAAYHLFRAKTEPDYDWRAAYLREAQERPVPGAPLPPGIFEDGSSPDSQLASVYGFPGASETRPPLVWHELGGAGDLAVILLPLIGALLAWQLGAGWLLSLGLLVAGVALGGALLRLRAHRAAAAEPHDHSTP